MTKKVLILGGSFAGLTSAYTLKRLVKDKAEIKVISKDRFMYFRPEFPHVALGKEDINKIKLDLEKILPKRKINFQEGEVIKIDADNNKVIYKKPDGNEVEEEYDYLIVALGAHLGKDLIKGFDKYGYSVCEPNDALKLRDKLKEFNGGKITIGSGQFYQGKKPRPEFIEKYAPLVDSACEGPVFELSLMLYSYFKNKGMLDKIKITVYSPGEYLSDLSPKLREHVKEMYKQMNIEIINNFRIKEIREDSVIDEKGNKIESDLSILIPPYTGNPALKNSSKKLIDDQGFVPVNEEMQSINYENVYAVGDASSLTIPKLGYLATYTARIAAESLANKLGVKTKIEKYNPSIICVADDPYGMKGIFVHDNTLYKGNISYSSIGLLNHYNKRIYTKMFMLFKGDLWFEKYLLKFM